MTYIIWPTMVEMIEQKEEFSKRVSALCGKKDFEIIPVVTENWNDDLSPWPYEDGRSVFGGKADLFLGKLLKQSREIKIETEDSLILAGYSLAGLFSLWAASKTDIFRSVASCSGSLWFPDFMDSKIFPKCRKVYLSLGNKEAKTKHPLMCQVENISRKYAEVLQKTNLYESVIFEMNPGNHFADVMERLAKGVAAII